MKLLKFAFVLFACVLLRLALVSLPLPNIEPIVALAMPLAASLGGVAGFAFALLANASFDFISGKVGLWTVYTSLAYGLVGFGAWWFLRGKALKAKHFIGYSVAGVLFFDLVTALMFGWQFAQTLEATLLGQIPFTFYHLLGATFFSLTLAPIAWNYLFKSETRVLNSSASKAAS